MKYAKINRDSGNVIKEKDFSTDNPRALNKPFVWLPVEQEVVPSYDEETHKVVHTVTQPDLSDLNVNVSPIAKRVQGYDIVVLSAQELQDKIDVKLTATDNQLTKAVELIFTKIATNGGVALQRSDFPNSLWDKINARRALRGEAPI
jgi:hypothetical protein